MADHEADPTGGALEEASGLMTGLTISNIILWILQISTIIVVVGLARQVGVLHLRVRPLGAGRTEDGPTIGDRFEMTSARSLRGEDIPITVQGRLSLLTFASPECGACAATMLAVKRLRDVEPDVWFVVAVDGEKEQALKYAEKYGLEDVASPEAFNRLGSSSRPFAVILAEDGTVLGSGVTQGYGQSSLCCS
jgi:methylamine dehydrogenase accessory protein MauD